MSTGRYQISFLKHAGKGLILFILFSLFFIQVAAAANPQIKLTTNRYVILDDPNSGFSSVTAKADTGFGFGVPKSWNSDVWKGESTTIRGVALVLDEKGLPKSGVTVTFAVLDWDDASARTLKSDTNSKTNVTDANGLATASFDLNSEQQYGRWKITARATVNGVAVSSDSNFVYNWWGCQNCHGDPYSNKAETKGYPDKVKSGDKLSPYDPYSPYITGRDFHNTMYTDHHLSGKDLVEGECWACHNSYDRDLHLGQANKIDGNSYPGKGTPSTYGVHANLACASCHSIIGTSERGSQTIKSCDASGCHQGATAFNPNVMRETVVATSPRIYVNYSAQDLNPGIRSLVNGIPTAATFLSNPLTGARAHTSATIQDIPCTVCHGPMHNVTKPDITTMSKNKVTEDSQCTSCHQPKKHSQTNPVYCTACHSQDAHKIQILGKDGTYKNRGSSGAITASRSDCTECHKTGPANTSLGSLKTRDPLAYTTNFDPAGKYNTQHPTADCANSCHNTTDFHNISKAAGGPDCLICHDSTGSAIHRVDGNSIAAGIHANLNPRTPADPNSKCWGCHQSDGSKPLNSMGDIFDRPYKCIDCHLSSGQKAGAYGAFIVDEHYPSGKDIRALVGNGSLQACIICHNKTQMKVNYLSPDNIFTNYSLVSHYGKKRIDMLNATNETNCAYCHKNTSEFNNVFQKNSNTQITHDNGQSCLNCHREQGSNKGRIHDSSLIAGGGPDCVSCHSGSGRAKVDVQSMNNPDYIHYDLNNNSNTGSLNSVNRICWGCHTNDTVASDKKVDFSELPQSGHPDGVRTPRNCTACHKGTVKFNAPLISEHNPAGDELKTKYTCVQCHNNSIRPFIDTQTNISTNTNNSDPDFNIGRVSHYANTSKLQVGGTESVYCLNCHNNSATGQKYGLNYQLGVHDAQECSNPNCHRNGGSQIKDLHDINLTKKVPFYNSDSDNYCSGCHPPTISPGFVGAHGNTTSSVNCMNCHMNKTTQVVTKMTNTPGTRNTNTVFHTPGKKVDGYPKALVPGNLSLERGTLEYKRSQCTICHDRAVNHNPTGVCSSCHASNNDNPTWHSRNITGGGGPDCKLCHDIGGSAEHHVDFKVTRQSIHGQLNNRTGNINEVCWGCHQTGGIEPSGMGDIFDKPYICTDCHLKNGTVAGIFGAPIADEHFKNGQDIRAVTGAATNVLSCLECHQNRSSMILPNNDTDTGTFDSDGNGIFGGPTSPYYYGRKRTDMKVADGTNCSYCHQNTSEFSSVFRNPDNTRITHDAGRQCSTCHGSGRIHDESLIGGGGPNCISCHTGSGRASVDVLSLNSSEYIHYKLNSNSATGPLDALNRICWGCHTNNTLSSDNRVDFSELPERGHPDGVRSPKSCTDCHIKGNFSAPLTSSHIPPRLPTRNENAYLSTTAYCSVCHNNSLRPFIDSQTNLSTNPGGSTNGSVSHYGTNTSLIKPTVNQTPLPRFGFVNSADASAYNKDCNRCHNPSNPNYG
ncbi:MAG: hypothetical protein O8C55_08770, partial [Candidatus Methanoperedens sp.]|nr:hypothetical protein [Candidatus Methanoperedens sp.]